jgi:hypothetical protein
LALSIVPRILKVGYHGPEVIYGGSQACGKSKMNRIMKVLLALVVLTVVCVINMKLAVIISLFAVGGIIAAAVERGEQFGAWAFHRCCSAIQWALMSFYLFIFETLATSVVPVKRELYLVVVILGLITLGLYVFSTVNVQKVLVDKGESRHIYTTAEEQLNVRLACWTVALILGFLLVAKYRLHLTF